MNKIRNRKKYKHNVNLIKYSEDGSKKRCMGCVEEFEKLQSSGYCNNCWAFLHREKRKGIKIENIFLKYKFKWDILKEKYKDVKKCNQCLIIKEKILFYPDKKSSSGYQNKCISCVKEYNLKFGYIKERDSKYQKERRKNNIQYKIKDVIGTGIWECLKNNKKHKSIVYLGCTIEELKSHLEQQFLPEMNWENHGEIWEIDHIKPISLFNFLIEEEIFECWNFTNLQPLFKTTEIAESFGYKGYVGNREKGNKYYE